MRIEFSAKWDNIPLKHLVERGQASAMNWPRSFLFVAIFTVIICSCGNYSKSGVGVLPSPTVGKVKLSEPQNSQPQSASSQNEKVYYRNKVAVLTYHHLDPKESAITITPERFNGHLQLLKMKGFHVIPVEEFIGFLQKRNSVPPNAVVITFDDGYESVYHYAIPLLKSARMTATVFLIVSYVGDGTLRTPPILNWQEVSVMHSQGFSFYSHTYNSHQSVYGPKGYEFSPLVVKLINPVTNRPETDGEYRTRIYTDLTKADDILKAKLGNTMNLLCFPHGQYNRTVIDVARQTGITYVFSGTEGFNTSNDTIIKRINAGSPYMTDQLLFRKLTKSRLFGGHL